jgi:hypothetical protein
MKLKGIRKEAEIHHYAPKQNYKGSKPKQARNTNRLKKTSETMHKITNSIPVLELVGFVSALDQKQSFISNFKKSNHSSTGEERIQTEPELRFNSDEILIEECYNKKSSNVRALLKKMHQFHEKSKLPSENLLMRR